MSETSIDVRGVSKRFCRDLKRSLLYGLQDIGKELTGRGQEADALRPHEFWALRDVSFTIERGESVGLIGHNGAGKTTVLKLVNGLMKPSRGSIVVTGSIRALIALGAGFNPVLTGRENIRIASAVLGYRAAETRAKFDEIVEFSELEEFIDAPVQSYSSGMLARLGFAVAVHTRPDIMLVDEVLAVGDLNFAIKCYRKISDFRNEGGSIMLVSHSPYVIRTNCDRAVWLEHGEVQMIGEVNAVCDQYELAVARTGTGPQQHYEDGMRLIDMMCPERISTGDSFFVELTIDSEREIEAPIVGMTLSAITGQPVVANFSSIDRADIEIKPGRNVIRTYYESLPLGRGVYGVSVVIAERYYNNQLLALINGRAFEVAADDDFGVGFLRIVPQWERSGA
jgi:lipopolysaccharide transport system ATP-binding protein